MSDGFIVAQQMASFPTNKTASLRVCEWAHWVGHMPRTCHRGQQKRQSTRGRHTHSLLSSRVGVCQVCQPNTAATGSLGVLTADLELP